MLMRIGLILALVAFLTIPYAMGQDEGEGLVSQILDRAVPSILWDVRGDRLLAGISASVVDYKGLVSLDVGAISDLNDSAFLVGISGNVEELAKKGGLNFNLPDRASLGVFYARDFSDKNWMMGLSVSYIISW